MSDPYLEHISIEIEQKKLRSYLRTQAFVMWTCGILFFSCLMSFAVFAGKIERGEYESLLDIGIICLSSAVLN